MPGRQFVGANGYRYGFNGKESDNEVMGAGAQYDYGFRIYDTRLGRFLSVDPLSPEYPWYSPYQFAGNNPIRFIDLDGKEQDDPIVFKESEKFYLIGFNVQAFVGGCNNETQEKFVPILSIPKKVTAEQIKTLIIEPFIIISKYNSLKEGDPEKPTFMEYAEAEITVAAFVAPFISETLAATAGTSNTAKASVLEAETASGQEFVIAAEGELESGAYSKLNKMVGGEKHHMPSNSSMNKMGIKKSEGTAINTEKKLHRGLPSTGNSMVAQAFRGKELELLKAGKFEEVWNLNAKALKDAYLKKGLSEDVIDAAMKKAKNHFMNNVVPKIKK
ncbi:MAG: hypothetical protein L6Q66_06440 [Bacteroidia bacterium]|nr:hypothetical protein [Bacteroidia bacterium]